MSTLLHSHSIVQPVSTDTFGPLVAYLVPGATVLLGFTPFSPTLESWFGTVPDHPPTIGGFLYLTVAALAAGMTASALRWAVIDTLHARTGLRVPTLNFARLGTNVEAFSLLIEIHYKHYLFYANMFVALSVAYVAHRVSLGWAASWGLPDIGVAALLALLFVTSRDTLTKYYSRSQQLLRGRATRRRMRGASS